MPSTCRASPALKAGTALDYVSATVRAKWSSHASLTLPPPPKINLPAVNCPISHQLKGEMKWGRENWTLQRDRSKKEICRENRADTEV